jgi:hypothetical protein
MAQPSTLREFEEYVRSTYAGDGVQIASVGNNFVTVALPPSVVDFSAFVATLCNKFDTAMDLQLTAQGGMELVCWPQRTGKTGSREHGYGITYLFLVTFVVLMATIGFLGNAEMFAAVARNLTRKEL